MVKQTQEPELTDDDYAEIANSIHRMGEMGRRLATSGLSKRAVIVLLHDATGVPMKQIKQVPAKHMLGNAVPPRLAQKILAEVCA